MENNEQVDINKLKVCLGVLKKNLDKSCESGLMNLSEAEEVIVSLKNLQQGVLLLEKMQNEKK